jgi:3'-5' exoribonuclease 1
MNYIVFDLESTCWEGEEGKKHISEIIEIGAVKINSQLETVDTFDMFIKPEINPVLTDFCKKLTTIKQSDVDGAEYFNAVLPKFVDWVSDGGKTPYWLCSWGFYDRKMLNSMCQYHTKATAWLKWHISIKHQFGDIMNMKACGMPSAMYMLQLEQTGTHHRGIDDAVNIAKIFVKIFDKLKFKR